MNAKELAILREKIQLGHNCENKPYYYGYLTNCELEFLIINNMANVTDSMKSFLNNTKKEKNYLNYKINEAVFRSIK